MQLASVSRIWQHFAGTFQAVETFNADGTQPCPHTATAAVLFNVPEAQVTPEQRNKVKRMLHFETYTRNGTRAA